MERVRASSKPQLPQTKIDVTLLDPVGSISVVTLIRTDTTLDHSQKAEKVCSTRVAWSPTLYGAEQRMGEPRQNGTTRLFRLGSFSISKIV